jgi:hypothetical protein
MVMVATALSTLAVYAVFAALNDGLIDPFDSVKPVSAASVLLVLDELVGLVGDALSPHPTATAAGTTTPSARTMCLRLKRFAVRLATA